MAGSKNFVEVIFAANTSNLQRAMKSVGKDTQAVGKSVKSLGKVALIAGATAALTGLGVAAKIGFGEMMEAEKVAAQTNAVLKSTGGIAKVTADEVNELAGSLMKKSGIDDELIQSGANVLLTFKNIRNEAGKGNKIFDQATVAALDLSVAMKTDLKSANILVGKALNDPITGLTSLTRVGITFTQAQKDQIKAMVESGNTMGAQKIILKELESQFGGSAEAAGKTLAGQINIAKESFNNLAGAIVMALLPAFQMGTSAVSWFVNLMSSHTTTTQIAIGVIGSLSAIILTVTASTKAWTAAQTAAKTIQSIFIKQTVAQATATTGAAVAQTKLNVAMRANIIGIVVTAVAALATGLVIAYKKSETFRSIVNKSFEVVHTAIDKAVGILDAFVDGLKQVLEWLGLLKREHADTAEDVVPSLNKIQKATQNLKIEGGRASKEFAFVIRGVRRTVNKDLRAAAKDVKTEVDNITLTMHEGADDARAAGDSVGTNYIQGQIAGIQRNQAALNAAVRQSQREAERQATDFWESNSPSRRAEKKIGKPIPEGTAKGIVKNIKAVKAAISQMGKEAIASAKANLGGLSGGLAGLLTGGIDAQGTRALGALQNSPEAVRLRELEQLQEKTAREREATNLLAALKEAKTKEEQTAAITAINDWGLQVQMEHLRQQLSDKEVLIQQETEARRKAAEQGLTDLTDALNRGLIKQEDFNTRLQTILADSQVTYEQLGTDLGSAVANNFLEQLVAMARQAAMILGSPKTAGSGSGISLIDPLAAMNQESNEKFRSQFRNWVEKRNQLQKNITAAEKSFKEKDSAGGKALTKGEKRALKNREAVLAEHLRNRPTQPAPVVYNLNVTSLDPRTAGQFIIDSLKQYARYNGQQFVLA